MLCFKLDIELRALCKLSKHLTSELHPGATLFERNETTQHKGNEDSSFLPSKQALLHRFQSLWPPHCFSVSVRMRLELRTETQIHKATQKSSLSLTFFPVSVLPSVLPPCPPCLTYLHDWTSSSLEGIPLKQLLPPHTSAGGPWKFWDVELGVS